MKKSFKRTSNHQAQKFTNQILQFILLVYIFFMFGIFPLYFENAYFNMGDAKYHFFRLVTISFLALITTFSLIHFIIQKITISSFLSTIPFSQTDFFVVLYFFSVILSYTFSPYKASSLLGSSGWYMGLLSQLFFVAIYLFYTNFFKWNRIVIWFLLPSSISVFLIGILNRFDCDPLQMYAKIDSYYKIEFLSTLGQSTWYSSYLCIILPIAMVLYWKSSSPLSKTGYACFSILGFISLVTQNSDSAYVGIGLAFLLLFWFSFSSTKRFKSFFELLLFCLFSFRVTGFLQIFFSDRVIPLEDLSLFLSQDNRFLFLLIPLSLLYIYLFFYNCKLQVKKYKRLRSFIFFLFFSFIIALFVCVCLTTNGVLPVFETNNYLNFNNLWGNNRGFSWKHAATIIQNRSLLQTIFGCGPDAFEAYSYSLYSDKLTAKFGSSHLTNAHNEWLTALVNLGLIGAVSYIGIFITSFIAFLKKQKESSFLLAIAASTISYMGHNFFCYQQVICTPLIFILIGMGNGILHSKQKSS